MDSNVIRKALEQGVGGEWTDEEVAAVQAGVRRLRELAASLRELPIQSAEPLPAPPLEADL